MAEARYRGTKVVTVFGHDNTKFADEWMAPRGAPTARWPWRWATSSLRNSSYATGSLRRLCPPVHRPAFLVTLEEKREGVLVPAKMLTAADLGDRGRGERAVQTGVVDGATNALAGAKRFPGFRYGDQGQGKWNLDPRRHRARAPCVGADAAETALVTLSRFGTSTAPAPRCTSAGVPVRATTGGHRCTVFDLMLAQYGVGVPTPR